MAGGFASRTRCRRRTRLWLGRLHTRDAGRGNFAAVVETELGARGEAVIYDPLDKHISTGEPIQPFVPEHRASSSVCTSRKRYSELNWFSEKQIDPVHAVSLMVLRGD